MADCSSLLSIFYVSSSYAKRAAMRIRAPGFEVSPQGAVRLLPGPRDASVTGHGLRVRPWAWAFLQRVRSVRLDSN